MGIKKFIFIALSFCFFVGTSNASNQDTIQNDVASLKAFVDSGIGYIKEHGKNQAYEEFSNIKGRFARGNWYLFVVGYNGKVFAHGGDPNRWVGETIFNAKDEYGTPFFQLFVEAARRKGGVVSYYWPRPEDKKIQYKTSYIAPIDDKTFIGAGMYKSPLISSEQKEKIAKLKQFIVSAVEYFKQKGAAEAYKEFNNKNGKFVKDNLYIFVVEYNGKVLAHGGDPQKQVGTNISELKDEFGTPLLMLFSNAAKNGGGLAHYYWYRYKDKETLGFKSSYIEPLDENTFIGAGFYREDEKK